MYTYENCSKAWWWKLDIDLLFILKVFPSKLNQNWNWIGFVLLLVIWCNNIIWKRFFRFSLFDNKKRENWSSFISFFFSSQSIFWSHFQQMENSCHRNKLQSIFLLFNWSLKFVKVLLKNFNEKYPYNEIVHLHFNKKNKKNGKLFCLPWKWLRHSN